MEKTNSGSYDYQGIVICSTGAEYQHYETDLVLILKSQRERYTLTNRIYGVSKDAFVPPREEYTYDDLERAKNIERRFAMPLKFGDILQFNDKDIDHHKNLINRFHRERPIYEASSNDSGYLLRLGGVLNPAKPTTFWTPLDVVTIPTVDASRAEPNVWLFAWIRVETRMRCSQDEYSLDLTFDSFADCDPSEQGRVCEAPWHRGSYESKFSMLAADPYPCDSDDEIDLEPRKDIYIVENKWAEKIHKQLGLFVGERLLLCKDLPQYDFIIPLLKPVTVAPGDSRTFLYPSIGEYFHFTAEWSVHHNGFLVTEMLPVQVLRGHTTSVSGNILVRVNPAKFCGLYNDKDNSLGLIDDPQHALCFSDFHPASHDGLKALVEVRAVRATENRSVRWRIVRAVSDDDHVARFRQWLSTARFFVGPINGMVISKDTVISAEHPGVYFRLPVQREERVSPGCGVRFRGRREPGVDSEIMIEEFIVEKNHSARAVIENDEIRLFQVKIKMIGGEDQLARNPIFGPVDMRQLEAPKDKDVNDEFHAWVMESPIVNNCRRACTIMEVFSVALNTPMLPAPSTASRSGSRLSNPTTPSGSSHGGSTSSQNSSKSIKHNRFVGPAFNKSSKSSNKSSSAHSSDA